MRSPKRRQSHAQLSNDDAGAGDRASGDTADRVGRLYEQYSPQIAAYALRRTTRADAGDVVAETFLVAWRKSDQIPSEPMALAWLYGVARRVLANQARARRRRSRLHDRLSAHAVQPQAPSTRLEVAEGFERVAVALSRLSADDVEVLRLCAWEDLSPCEIASVLDLEPATVRQRLHRARKRLRKQLALVETNPQPGKRVDRSDRSVVRQSIAGTNLGTLGFGGGHRG